jgi:hypothetical protein
MIRLYVSLLLLLLIAPIAGAAGSAEKVVLLESAISGYMDSQYQLGNIYEKEAQNAGDYFDPDIELLKKAVYWYEQASEQGHQHAQVSLISIYQSYSENLGIEGKWLALITKMAEEGNIGAQFALAEYYTDGDEVERDRELAIHWLEKVVEDHTRDGSARRIDGDLLGMLADLYMEEPSTVERQRKAFKLYLAGAGVGHFESLIKAAGCYVSGIGTEQDMRKAFPLYLEAAQDTAKASSQLYYGVGMAYADGEVVAEDAEQAAQWIKQAVMLHNTDAMHKMGHFYADGYGVDKDPKKAFELYMKASEKGSLESVVHVADMLTDGIGTDKSIMEAGKFYQYAASKGEAKGQAKLGLWRYNLAQSQKDYQAAYFWVQLAALGNSEIEPQLMATLKEKLSAEEQADLELQAKGAYGLANHAISL